MSYFKNRKIIKQLSQMIKFISAQFCGNILTCHISRADEKGKSLCPGIIRSFPLRLDLQVAISHDFKKTLKVCFAKTFRVYWATLPPFSFLPLVALTPPRAESQSASTQSTPLELPLKVWSQEQARDPGQPFLPSEFGR